MCLCSGTIHGTILGVCLVIARIPHFLCHFAVSVLVSFFYDAAFMSNMTARFLTHCMICRLQMLATCAPCSYFTAVGTVAKVTVWWQI